MLKFIKSTNNRLRASTRGGGCFLASATAFVFVLGGCSGTSSSVIATTGTTIGVELSADAASQTPTAVLGYRRAEFAYVPTNRSSATKSSTTEEGGTTTITEDGGTPSTGEGARDTANVLMELRFKGIFARGPGGGIYQRLAVGDIAVQQPGATLMFARGDDGVVDPKVAEYVAMASMQILTDREKIVKIVAAVIGQNDAIDAAKLNALVDKAALADARRMDSTVVARIKQVTTGTELKVLLFGLLDGAIDPLFNAL